MRVHLPRIFVRVFLIAFLCGLCGSLLGGCASAPPPPPPVRVEVRPTKPGLRAVWVPGHWKWKGKRRGYIWVPGHWKRR